MAVGRQTDFSQLAQPAEFFMGGENPTVNRQLVLRSCPASSVAEAAALALGYLPEEVRQQRCEELAEEVRSGHVPGGLFEARRGERLVGAVLAEIHPGRAAIVYPPQLVADEPETTKTTLLQAVVHYLQQCKVRVAHLLVPARIPAEERLFAEHRFQYMAVLHYLVCEADRFPAQCPPAEVQFVPYHDTPQEHRRLCRVIEATYEGTLDCPALSGVREIDDVVAGYRSVGVFSPERWLFVRHNTQDVGCLLLADHPEQDLWELVYMGLVPAARGRGWGRQIVQHALWLAGRSGRSRVVAAVDAANSPALDMYRAAGFQCWDRRVVYQRLFP